MVPPFAGLAVAALSAAAQCSGGQRFQSLLSNVDPSFAASAAVINASASADEKASNIIPLTENVRVEPERAKEKETRGTLLIIP